LLLVLREDAEEKHIELGGCGCSTFSFFGLG
jgi:hypothetical protein